MSSFPRSSSRSTYDAEYHIGLIPDDDTEGDYNAEVLNAAADAMWPGGDFDFSNGGSGPVLKPISFAAKRFYFSDTIKLRKSLGAKFIGATKAPYPVPDNTYELGGQGGMSTRFIRTNGGGSVIRIRGAETEISRIEFRSRDYPEDGTSSGPTAGTRTTAAIEIEGNNTISTGRPLIEHCTFLDFPKAICGLDGYYDDNDDFVTNENHVDNGKVSNCKFYNCQSGWWSNNWQAVNWNFDNCEVGYFGGSGVIPCVLIDAVRGGHHHLTGITALNHPQVTLFRISNGLSGSGSRFYSPYHSDFICDNFNWDRFVDPTAYITLFDYAGPVFPDVSFMEYTVRCKGALNATGAECDLTQLVKFGDGTSTFKMPRTDLLFDVKNMPTDDFTQIGHMWAPTGW